MNNVSAVKLLRIRYMLGLGLIALVISALFLAMQWVIAEQIERGAGIDFSANQIRSTDQIAAIIEKQQKTTRESLEKLQNTSQLFWIATLLVLPLIGVFIFKPFEHTVRRSIIDLRETIAELESTREQSISARQKAESSSYAKSQFLATMSHELRTPMNGVLGMSELLSSTRLDKKQLEYVQIIVDSSESLLTIINDILDFSRLEAGKVGLEQVPFNLEQATYDVMALLAPRCHNKGIELILDYPPDLPRDFIGDSARIRQILFNLIGNAGKFTDQGYIQVSVAINIGQDEQADISIHIEDTGIGIAPDKINGLFRSFNQADNSTTRKYGGTGLGLSITRELVNLMGGQISINSSPGKGSVFSVEISLKITDPIEMLRVPEVCVHNVMLLEPNQIYRDLIVDRLARIEVEASAVGDAEDMKSRLLLCQEHGGAMQVAMIDQDTISDPANNWACFSEGRSVNPIAWVILGSELDDSDEFHRHTESARAYTIVMQKPFTNHQLYYALSSALMQPNAERTNLTLPGRVDDTTDFTLSKVIKGDILLVEDNHANQKFASLLLGKMGYSADIAEDGIEAIQLWRKNDYDLILMDCQMPNMDGYEATFNIRREEKTANHVPIIALTANASETDRKKCRDCGMDEVITKPYRKQELVDLLDRWLSEEPYLMSISSSVTQTARTG